MSQPANRRRRGVEALVSRLVQADFGDGEDRSLRALEAYVGDDPVRSARHLSVMDLWEELGELDEPALDEDRETVVPLPRKRLRDFHVPWHKLAAAIVPLMMLVGIGLLVYRDIEPMRPAESAPMLLRTAAAERRIVTLPDGSTITLGPQSAVRVQLGADARRLQLDRGEAMFEVAHDPSRPFTVAAGSGEVRAVGTAFNIRLLESRVVVTVIEGTVSVTAGRSAAGATGRRGVVQMARAGEQLSYAATGMTSVMPAGRVSQHAISAARPVQADDYASWARGYLRFQGEPLTRVVAEVNRYSPRRIRLLDPELGQTPIYGVLHVGDYQGLLSIVKDLEGMSDSELARRMSVEPSGMDAAEGDGR